MFFHLAKLADGWTTPLGLVLFLLAAGVSLSWSRPRLSRALLVAGAVVLWGFASRGVADRLLGPLERAYPVPPAALRAEAAIVLAGTVDLRRSTPDRIELYDRPERLIEGARLVKSGRARWLVVSGGSGDPEWQRTREADLLARFAQDLGVPDDRILLQRESRTTAEDARFTARLLKERDIRSAFLVTSAFHMPRALACFRRVGWDPTPYPVDFRSTPSFGGLVAWLPSAPALQTSTLAVHELVGYAAYRVSGRL